MEIYTKDNKIITELTDRLEITAWNFNIFYELIVSDFLSDGIELNENHFIHWDFVREISKVVRGFDLAYTLDGEEHTGWNFFDEITEYEILKEENEDLCVKIIMKDWKTQNIIFEISFTFDSLIETMGHRILSENEMRDFIRTMKNI